MHRTTWIALGGATAVLLLAGCTAASKGDATDSEPAPIVSTVQVPASSSASGSASAVASATPIVVGPTTTAAGTCPLLATASALDDLGERLGNVTVSTSGGHVVGCTFYPATGALATSEHLPPRTVPVIAITVTHYADTTAAHNAMVLSSRVDPDAYSDPATGVDEAISFATTFYAADGNQDRAYTFRKGTTVVLVRVAQTSPAFNAKHLGTDVAPAIH